MSCLLLSHRAQSRPAEMGEHIVLPPQCCDVTPCSGCDTPVALGSACHVRVKHGGRELADESESGSRS